MSTIGSHAFSLSRLRLGAVVVALSLLAACTTPFQARVARFQQMPAPNGESFAIEAADPAKKGGLEFATYAAQVRQQLAALGYQAAAEGAKPSLIVKLDYGVSDPRERVVQRPGFVSGRFAYGPYGYWPGWSMWGPGYYDPFWGPMWDRPEVYSYTLYHSFLDMEIRRVSGESVFEGRAETDARTNDMPSLVPQLVQAMFTNFPGKTGETVRIKLPPAPKAAK